MKSFVIFCICAIGATWANDVLIETLVADAFTPEEVDRRAVVSALSNAAVLDAAKAFSGAIGAKSAISNSRMSQSFEDSCLGGDKIINPWTKSSLSSLLGPGSKIPTFSSLSKLSVGKRAEQMANRDIVFVLDTSGSIPQAQFDKAKKAITTLVEAFCPSTYGNAVTNAGNKQIAVVLFGATVTTEVTFSESAKGLGYLQDKILSMKHRSEGSTATGDALTYVRNNVLGKGASRLTNKKVATDVIIITDGQCNRNCRILGSEADKIRKMGNGVNVFAMGVANARACELEIITGQGTNLAYGLGDFRNFDRFAQAVKEIAQENPKKCA